jgi:hypothetical protein
MRDVIVERFDSGEISESESSGSKTLIYAINCADETVASLWAMSDESPAVVMLPSGRLAYRDDYTTTPLGGRNFEVSINYNTAKAPEDSGGGDSGVDWNFGISGQTVHVTQSKEQFKFPSSATDYKKAIGVSNDGVAGVDDEVGSLSWSEPHDFPRASITPAFARMLRSAYGKTNSGTFRGFEAQSVKFKGVTGAPKDAEMFKLNFNFEAGEHATGLTVGEISGISKKAWDYLWVRYEDDDDSGNPIKKAIAVYVDRLKDTFDFSNFGIGT